MRLTYTLLVAALLALATQGCAQNSAEGYSTATHEKDCPSGDCNGLSGTGNIGGPAQ